MLLNVQADKAVEQITELICDAIQNPIFWDASFYISYIQDLKYFIIWIRSYTTKNKKGLRRIEH